MAANRLQTSPQGTYQFWLALLTFLLLPLLMAVLVNTGQFRGLQSQDAIEQAVTARNLASGQGFTTEIIRPRAIALAKEKTLERQPELIQAPLSVLPAALAAKLGKGEFASGKSLALMSMLAFIAIVYAVAVIGTSLFGAGVGRFAALLTCLSPAALVGISISGDGRSWACLWLLLLWLVLMREPAGTKRSVLCGLFMGLAMLTGYALVLPLLLGVLPALLLLKPPEPEAPLAPGTEAPAEGEVRVAPVQRRLDLKGAGIALGVIVVLALPWMFRNINVTGLPVPGLGTYDVMRNTDPVPGRSIERSYVGPGTSWIKFFGKATRASFKKAANGVYAMRVALPAATEWLLLALMVGCLLLPLPPEQRLGGGALAWCLVWDVALTSLTSQNYAHTVLWLPLVALFAARATVTSLEAVISHPARKWLVTWQPPALRKWAQAAVLLILAAPSLYPQMFTPDPPAAHPSAANHEFLRTEVGEDAAVITDDPWTVALYIDRPAIWLPQTQEDLTAVLKLGDVYGMYFTRRAQQLFGWATVGEDDTVIQEAGDWWQWAAGIPAGYLDFQRVPSRTDGEVLLVYRAPTQPVGQPGEQPPPGS